ncbi:MAG: hypothetical protein QNK37_09500 [Acidobacteriota bacterium]|nr:hypothetical protein [Acidobacteriota bacterium]
MAIPADSITEYHEEIGAVIGKIEMLENQLSQGIIIQRAYFEQTVAPLRARLTEFRTGRKTSN